MPPDAERFLRALAQRPTREWVRAARACATARRSLMFAEARRSLGAVLDFARADAAAAALASDIIRRIEEGVRVVRPLVRTPAALRAMRQPATAAVLAHTFRERLTPAELALLAAPFRGGAIRRPFDGRLTAV